MRRLDPKYLHPDTKWTSDSEEPRNVRMELQPRERDETMRRLATNGHFRPKLSETKTNMISDVVKGGVLLTALTERNNRANAIDAIWHRKWGRENGTIGWERDRKHKRSSTFNLLYEPQTVRSRSADRLPPTLSITTTLSQLLIKDLSPFLIFFPANIPSLPSMSLPSPPGPTG